MATKWSIFSVVRLLRKPSKRSTKESESQPSPAKEASSSNSRASAKHKKAPERRESGRFQSAARLIRSLAKTKEDGSTEPDASRDPEAGLCRSNPQYHSDGKGLRKKPSEKHLNALAHKERSRSFCEKPEAKNRVSQQLKKRSSFKRSSPNDPSASKAKAVQGIGSPSFKAEIRPFASRGSPRRDLSAEIPPENGVAVKDSLASVAEEAPTGDASRPESALRMPHVELERDKDRRSLRKLTKDSGYETSPYSEGDYTTIDAYSSELEALAAEVARESDEATLRADSELSSLETLIPQHSRSGSLSGDAPKLYSRDAGCVSGKVSSSPPRSNGDQCEGDATGDCLPQQVAKAEGTTLSRGSLAPQEDAPLPPVEKRRLSSDSLVNFAESLLVRLPSPSPPSACLLLPAKSTPALCQHVPTTSADEGISSPPSDRLAGPLHASKSTPNLDDVSDQIMVTRQSAMHPYVHGSPPSNKPSSGGGKSAFWDISPLQKDKYNQSDYAHHIRSSSYQLMHSRHVPSNSYHHRQHSNTSTYSEGDEPSPKSSRIDTVGSRHSPFSMENSRCFSFENVVPEPVTHVEQANWNSSEPDLNFMNAYFTPASGFSFSTKEILDSPKNCPTSPTLSASSRSKNSPSVRLSGSPPAPPVRDASSLKYIRYGPGHEKYPSWPVPAGSVNQVIPNSQSPLGANISGLPDVASYLPAPQGSHRSHSWTEQSEYPKDKSGGYTRPQHKKQMSPSHKQLLTAMKKCDKLSPNAFNSRFPEDILQSPDYSLMDDYLNHSSVYYPPFDREGRGIGDKDYTIPSPPERDPGMGEANLSQVTAAQLEEHARQYDYGYGDFPQITPLLDQLRQESYMWEGGSEKDSGRGESESVADSSRYSNGRESVTTVVTNSSSASSSETLKWHGSMSDVSSLSGISRDLRPDHNIAHSSKVLAPQRHNSESVLYYSPDGKKISHPKVPDTVRHHREASRYNNIADYSRYIKDPRWNRECERKNEANNLKKFPSYSYTQPLSQISEAPVAESSEGTHSQEVRTIKSPVIDFSKPPSVAERINELERQSRSSTNELAFRYPRDLSEPRSSRRHREDHRRDPSLGRDSMFRSEFRRNSSEKDLSLSHLEPHNDLKLRETFNSSISSSSALSPTLTPNKSFRSSPGSVNPRSPLRKDLNDSLASTDSSLSFMATHSDSERVQPNSRTYTYLDPEKKCMVPDTTLKSIQKQAILSFYERRTGKNVTGSSIAKDVGVPISNGSSPPAGERLHTKLLGHGLRAPPGRAGKGVAKLGRVPDGDADPQQQQPQPSRPIRRRSVNGRDASKEEHKRHEISPRSSVSSNSPTRSDLPPMLPTKPQQAHANNKLDGAATEEEGGKEERAVQEENSYQRGCPELSSLSPESRLPQASNSLPLTPLSPLSVCHSKGSTSAPEEERPAPALPPPPTEDTPRKPPDRPPKRPSLRSLFHAPRSELVSPLGACADKLSPEIAEIRRIEQSAEELRNLSAPTKPSFYRKPPAPDPPESPPAPPLPPVPGSVAPEEVSSVAISEAPHTASPASRCSTPELPPPPPPPPPSVGEGAFSDDPLPPPPTDVSTHANPCSGPPPQDGSYHKDSYVAHRKDLKTGFEGRYRRTQSPSAPHQRNSPNPCSNTKNYNNNNNAYVSSSNNTNHLANPFHPPPQSNGVLRSAFSTSNIVQHNPPSSVLDNDIHGHSSNNIGLSNGCNNDFSPSAVGQYNGWAAHPRQSSTTVNFTAEEFRAFKAKRAAPEMLIPSNSEREFISPKVGSSSSPPRDPVGGSMCSLSTDGSSSSSSSTAYSDSLPLHVGPYWATSLDCLHRTSPESQQTPNTFSSPGRSIARAISIGEPLCRIADSSQERLPRLVPVSADNSLSRSTSAAESLSLSCHGGTVSRSNSVNSESLSSPYSIDSNTLASSPGVISHDGPITAHPATVTEDSSHPPSPCSSKSLDDDASSSQSPLVGSPSSSVSGSPLVSQTPPVLTTSPSEDSPSTKTSTASPFLSTSLSSPLTANQSSLLTSSEASSSTCVAVSTQSPCLSASAVIPSVSSSTPAVSCSTTLASSKPAYLRSLSATGTSPAMAPMDNCDDSDVDRTNIVVLGYGRTRSQEEIDCDLLTNEFAQRLGSENHLQALLAASVSQKTAAHYMAGVFTLELRSDLLCRCHANHPDLRQPSFPTEDPSLNGLGPPPAPPAGDPSEGRTLLLNGSLENEDFKSRKSEKCSPTQNDSVRFTTAENKILSRVGQLNLNAGEHPSDATTDSNQLMKKKEELISNIHHKLDILSKERTTIENEITQNNELGQEVTSKLEEKAKEAEVAKIKIHIEEIDKITSLFLSLSGRLAKAENSLNLSMEDATQDERRILESKREKLKDQLEEAKKLKDCIDRRAIQVSRILSPYLTEEEFAQYDHFIKMKAKLLMDARETQEKIKVGEDQLKALKNALPNS